MARTPVTNAAFTAADGTHPAGFTDLSNGFGQVQVIGNKYHCGFGFPADSRDNGTFSTGQYAEVVLSGFTGTGNTDEVGIGLLFSADTQPNRDGYRVYIRDGATVSLIVEKVVNDAITVLRTDTSVGWTAGDVLSAEADPSGGSSTVIKLFKNDVQVGTNLTDSSSPHTTGKPGLYAKGGASDTLRGDDYEAGDGFLDAGTSPNVTSTSTATPANGSSLTITGTNFGATQGAGGVTIGGISQTVTAWSATSITVTVARGTNKYGVAVNVVVTDNALVSSAPYALTSIQPQAGWAFVNLGTPNKIVANRLQTSPDLASGDQIAYDTISGGVTVATDASFTAANTVTRFQFEAWTPADGWGALGEQQIYPQWFAPASADSYELAAKVAQFQSLLNPATWFGPIAVEKWFADEINAVAGAQSASITESATATDAQTAALSAVAARSEPATATDTPAATAVFVVAVSEAASAVDACSATVTTGAAITEAASALDAPSAVAAFAAAAVESATATDTAAAVLAAQASVTESSAATDTPDATASGALSASITESATAAAAESAVMAAVAAASEAATAGHTQAGAAQYPVAITEAATASHSQDASNLGGVVGVTEAAAAASTQSALAAFAATILEPAAADAIGAATAAWIAAQLEAANAATTQDAAGGSSADNRIFLTISEALIVQHLISDAAQVDLRISD